MKFSQVIEHKMDIFFFLNHSENNAGRLVTHLLFFKKALDEVKVSGLQLSFNILQKLSTCHK